MRTTTAIGLALWTLAFSPAAWAQSETPPATEDAGEATAETTETASEETAEADDSGLLSDTELQTLVAPVALYPDTLLIQILVGATQPLEVIKADHFLSDNEGRDPAELKPEIEAEEWDPSVEVLATAFPDVIGDMAAHIEWTETVGDAMLAQSDDVMDAVQVMRTQAINSGALISGEEQTVEVEEEEVIITPTDPEVVYVPQYTADEVYATDTSGTDLLVAGAIGFGTYALIDAIFDDDDDWDDYWGCRNCGGWGGGPIIRDPDIDIDVDGNVNIGNNIGNGNRPDRNPDGSWKPEDGRADGAKDKISQKRNENGDTKLPINKPDRGQASTDDLRNQLSNRAGAEDITRPASRPEINRSGNADRAAAIDKTKERAGGGAVDRPAAAKKAAAKKPAVAKKATSVKKPAAKAVHKNPSAMKKRASGTKSRQASSRGKASSHRAKRR